MNVNANPDPTNDMLAAMLLGALIGALGYICSVLR